MNIDLKNLSSEPDILHQMICALSAKVISLTDEIQSLKDQLALLKAKRFGKSSEKLDKQIDELEQRIESNELDALDEEKQSGQIKTSNQNHNTTLSD
jgi:predicted nuclease with TOPRIM domain